MDGAAILPISELSFPFFDIASATAAATNRLNSSAVKVTTVPAFTLELKPGFAPGILELELCIPTLALEPGVAAWI